MTGGAGHLLLVLPRLVLNRLRWHRLRYDRYEIAFPSKQLSNKYFMATGISCVFLSTCNKLQFTIVDTYLTFALASYPGPEIGPGINRLVHAPILRGNIDGNRYDDVQTGRRVSTIRHSCFIIISCLYLQNFRELAKSSQLALERSVQQVSLKRTKASSAKVVSPETSRWRPPTGVKDAAEKRLEFDGA